MYNILVCDDDKEIVEAIEIYLSQEGYRIFKAYDGMEALEVLKKNDIHLLLIDVMMPKLDGIRATMKIREYSGIPIIILSAKSEDVDKILGSRRLCDKTVQSSGADRARKIPAPPLYPAGHDERGERNRVPHRRPVRQRRRKNSYGGRGSGEAYAHGV